jgi:hypothetical protein
MKTLLHVLRLAHVLLTVVLVVNALVIAAKTVVVEASKL